jgi:hypothetical protein
MSIYRYNGCAEVLRRLLSETTHEAGKAVLHVREADMLIPAEERDEHGLESRYWPDASDAGQVLDFGGSSVWVVTLVQKQQAGGRLTGCVVSIAAVENPFPDEITAAGSSAALLHAPSAERMAQAVSPLGLARAGVWGIRSDGGYAQILRLYFDSIVDEKRTSKDPVGNPCQRKIGRTELMVDYRYEDTVTAARQLDQQATATLADYQATYTHIEGTLEAHLQVSKLVAEGGELPEELAQEIARDQAEAAQASTGLVTSSNPDFLRAVALRAERSSNVATVLRSALERNMTELRNRLAGKMAGLHTALARFKVQIEKVQRLIVTLEIYLGVHENLIQIATGEAAPVDAPITLRQLVLYADEEFGDPANGGLTFAELPAFDAWLVDSGAFRALAPEQRCVVAIKPRRKPRRDAEGMTMPPMKDAQGKELDDYTYILIRNGDNVYRIQTPNVRVGKTLFPLRADFQKLLDRMSEVQEQEEKVLAGKIGAGQAERFRGEVEQELHDYQKSVLLLQGLLFRTDVLHPLPGGLNLMKPDTYGGLVQFIYDAEALLPSGRLSFQAWQADLASRIKRGSRVLVAIFKTYKGDYLNQSDYKDRFTLSNLIRKDSTPPLPKMGVYSVDSYEEFRYEPLYDELPWAEAPEENREGWVRQHRRYDCDLKDWVVSTPQPALLKCPRIGADGNRAYATTYRTHLLIRYNPGDIVTTGGWGQDYSEHKRKNAVGFRIKPGQDEWLFNYDELTLDDINFYLTDRVERQHYARMMPFLYELRDQLQKELAWEAEFARLLSQRLETQLADQLPAGVDLGALTQEAISWYKMEKVQIKRALTDNDAAALRMVEQRVRYYLRERHKLKDVEAGVDYRKKVLVWHHKQTGRSFVGTGLLKAEFVTECMSEAQYALPWQFTKPRAEKEGRVTPTRIAREMQDTTLSEAVLLATAKPGQVLELPRVKSQTPA